MHGPLRGSGADTVLVHASLAGGDYLPGDSRPSGNRDTAPWSDLAIQRTTPALLGLFSIVTLLADRRAKRGALPIRRTAWYAKEAATFSDALASVRRLLWAVSIYSMSPEIDDVRKLRAHMVDRLSNALCYAA
jgi:hypothetical protein